VVLKVLFFLRFDPQLDTPTNSGDVRYRVAYVGEMIASEAFCHISRSFHKSIGPSNARIASFLATNIRSEWSHLIWAKIGSDQMRPFRSDVSFSTLSPICGPTCKSARSACCPSRCCDNLCATRIYGSRTIFPTILQ